jgi:hypothetical protein
LNHELEQLTCENLLAEANRKSEVNFMTRVLREVEKKFQVKEGNDFERMRHLVEICGKTKKKLKAKLERVKRVEAIARVCTKYERICDEVEGLKNDVGSFEKLDENSEASGFRKHSNHLRDNENFSKSETHASSGQKSSEKLCQCHQSSSKRESSSASEVSSIISGNVVNFHSSDDLEKFENLFKARSTVFSSTNFLELFLKKLSNIEAECEIMKVYKKVKANENQRLQSQIKELTIINSVNSNLTFLNLNTSQTIGNPTQISHQIPQIKTPVAMTKRFKLCKHCRDFYANL